MTPPAKPLSCEEHPLDNSLGNICGMAFGLGRAGHLEAATLLARAHAQQRSRND